MATLTFTLVVGAQTSTATISPTNARVGEFLDDLIAYYGGTPPLTQTQAADKWITDLMTGQVQFAKGLKQNRLNAAVAVADDLNGNV